MKFKTVKVIETLIKRAVAIHLNTCENSCDRPGHLRECAVEKKENAEALKALNRLNMVLQRLS